MDAASRPQRAILYVIVGTITGACVAAFERIVASGVLRHVMELPVWAIPLAIVVGLVIAVLSVRLLGARSPSTADEYITTFHADPTAISAREVPGKLLGSATTLGSGGALGFEGPSIYIGAAIASFVARHRAAHAPFFGRSLLVAGAAAGVSAVFKAPVTGAIFAIEVPFHEDHAKGSLMPALLGATSGYLAFIAVNGAERLFVTTGEPKIEFGHIAAALTLGLLCGIGARAFAAGVLRAKRLAATITPWLRILIAGVGIAGLVAASTAMSGEPLAVGSGYDVVEWIGSGDHPFWILVGILAVRFIAPLATLAGGGIGGLFVPLVIEGALLGAVFAHMLGDTTGLYPLIGVCAFLGAGYRTPLAGVAFVAEATGRPGFIVPGILATVVAQFFMGDASVSPYQSR